MEEWESRKRWKHQSHPAWNKPFSCADDILNIVSSNSLPLESSHSEMMYHQMRCVFKFSESCQNSTWMSRARDDYRDLSRREQQISTCLWINECIVQLIWFQFQQKCVTLSNTLLKIVTGGCFLKCCFTDLKTFQAESHKVNQRIGVWISNVPLAVTHLD